MIFVYNDHLSAADQYRIQFLYRGIKADIRLLQDNRLFRYPVIPDKLADICCQIPLLNQYAFAYSCRTLCVDRIRQILPCIHMWQILRVTGIYPAIRKVDHGYIRI